MPPKSQKRSNASGGHGKAAALNKASNPSKPEPRSPDSDDSAGNMCSICAEKASDWAVGSCLHTVCGDCSHRMRVLYKRNNCVMCNTELRQVVVVPLRHYRQGMTFEEAVALPGVFQDKQVQMWFVDRARHQHLKNVRGWKCSHKSCNAKGSQHSVFANPTQLRAHAKSEHHAIYCEICFSGNKSFVSEIQLYALDNDRNYSSRLRGHLRKEHPQCKFCRRYFLDDEKLYAHLQEKHETCAVCERSGRMHEYYVNFEQLERHYEKEHYVCHHESCRGVVFPTQIELQAHEHTRHGDGSRGARPRALRVNLQQLHGARDSTRNLEISPRDDRVEQERQAARRRAFLSSNVIFSGAFSLDDAAVHPLPGGASSASGASSSQPYAAASQAREETTAAAAPSSNDSVAQIKRPDDGHFHPLALPRDGEEMHARNSVLVRSMRSLLDPAAYEQFRQSSSQFHTGKISSDEYYDAAVDAFGVRGAVRDILPELVALLPTPLLREPLLQTCLRRTDTKASEAGYLGSTVPTASDSAGSSSGARQADEAFPTLNGASAPPRANVRIMRFGAPGPEEFPRLGRVNRTQAANDGTSSASQGGAPGKPEKPSIQRTAASVLRQSTPTSRMFGNQAAGPSSGRSTATSATKLSSGAFPSLTSSAAPSQATRVQTDASVKDAASSQQERELLPTDLSMRVGPVWGNSGACNRNGKKRGPGQGRRPATPPRAAIAMGSSSQFPNIRAAVPTPSSSPLSGSEVQSNRNTNRKNKVIDVMEISKARKNALAKSSLPKIGGSGYGFAWDRKKVQQKKKQIKSDRATSSDKTAQSNGCDVSASNNPVQAPCSIYSKKAPSENERAPDGIVCENLRAAKIDDSGPCDASGSEPATSFDPR